MSPLSLFGFALFGFFGFPGALFASFAPATNPQYAMSVVLEEAGFGGTNAAPVARRVYEGLIGQPLGAITTGTGRD